MNNYSEQDIIESLKQLDIQNGDTIFIHSNIGLFGILEGAEEKQDYFTIFKNSIFKVIGEDGTIVFPTFSYSYCKNESYNPETTKSTVGILSNLALNDNQGIRSLDPNFSILAFGKNKEFFTQNPAKHSFGENSFWERFIDKDGKILFFNLNLSKLTLLHYVEKKLNVCYRYDKHFHGKTIHKKNHLHNTYSHFVYDLKKDEHQLDTRKLQEKAESLNLVKRANLGRGYILSVNSNEISSLIGKELKVDHSFLIKTNISPYEFKSELSNSLKKLIPSKEQKKSKLPLELFDVITKEFDFEIEIQKLNSGQSIGVTHLSGNGIDTKAIVTYFPKNEYDNVSDILGISYVIDYLKSIEQRKSNLVFLFLPQNFNSENMPNVLSNSFYNIDMMLIIKDTAKSGKGVLIPYKDHKLNTINIYTRNSKNPMNTEQNNSVEDLEDSINFLKKYLLEI